MNDLLVDDALSRLPAVVPVSRRDLEDIIWPIRVAEDWLLSGGTDGSGFKRR